MAISTSTLRLCACIVLVAGITIGPAPSFAQQHFANCPSVTGNDATVILPASINFHINGQAPAAGDEIAVFTPRGTCAGAGVWDGTNIGFPIWGDDVYSEGVVEGFTSGEAMSFRIWDASDAREYRDVSLTFSSDPPYAATGTYETNAIYLLSSVTALSEADEQTISLAGGWNMMSSNIEPTDGSIEAVLASISSSVVLVKDGNGGIYWPDQNVNTIADWNAQRGYLTYLTQPETLVLQGTAIDASQTPIPLASGWNSVAYWGATPQEVSQAIASISPSVVAVKNVNGEVYMPSLNIDMLGTLDPGTGYLMYLTQAAELSYSTSAPKSGHVSTGKPGLASSATIVFEDSDMAAGSVIVARTHGREVARAVVQNGRAVLILRGDDPLTVSVDGAVPGETVELYRLEGTSEHPMSVYRTRDALTGRPIADATLIYEENKIWQLDGAALQGLPSDYELEANYPNPFNPTTTIAYALPKPGHASVEVYDMIGRRLEVLVNEYQQAGTYEVRFDANDLPSGSYVYRLEAGGYIRHRQMVLAK